MGSPKHQRKKYTTPIHPWQRLRIEEEKEIFENYGLKNKKELWKVESILRKFKRQAKHLISLQTKQEIIEQKQLIDKLNKLNLIKKNAKLEDVLGLNLKDLLNRRLQSIVYNKNLAKSMKQARQFIVHGNILVGDKKVDVPSYLVSEDDENKIFFDSASSLADINHPERIKEEKKVEEKKPKRKVVKVVKKK